MANEKSVKALIYATFKDDVAFSIRDMKQFIKNGGELDIAQITAILDKLYINLAIELEENEVNNPEKVLVSAEQYLEAAQVKFLEIPLYADVITDNTDIGEIDVIEGYINIDDKSYPILVDADVSTLKRAGISRRGRTITSFPELIEYVDAIPTVYAIQFVYNENGTIIGYRVWVSDKS